MMNYYVAWTINTYCTLWKSKWVATQYSRLMESELLPLIIFILNCNDNNPKTLNKLLTKNDFNIRAEPVD